MGDRSRFVALVLSFALADCSAAPAPGVRSALREKDAAGGISLRAAAPSEPSAAGTCPDSSPVVCSDGCCPAGSLCADGGCERASSPAAAPCPSETPLRCAFASSCADGCRVFDRSTNRNHAVVERAPLGALPVPVVRFLPGRFGGALRVGSCPSPVHAPTIGLPDREVPFTLQAWLRMDPGTDFDGVVLQLVGALSPSGAEELWSLRVTAGAPSFVLRSQSTRWRGADSDAPRIDDGGWHALAAVHGTRTLALYVDGVLRDRHEYSADVAPGVGARLYFGGTGLSPSRAFPGELDEVRLLGFAASAEDVAADFARGPLDAVAGTLGLWRFDEMLETQCCPRGTICGPGGSCLASPLCPESHPVRCPDDGPCCLDASLCAVGGCIAPAPSTRCESPTSVPCRGRCCPDEMGCGPDGRCARTLATDGVAHCDAGLLPVPLSPGAGYLCCPPGSEAVVASGLRLCASAQICIRHNECPTTFPRCDQCDYSPYGCYNGPGLCHAYASYGQCPSGTRLCAWSAPSLATCCPEDALCGPRGQCCPPDKPPCGGGCCATQDCQSGLCTAEPLSPCESGEPLCADVCCPPGARCVDGLCLQAPPDPSSCGEGTLCGTACCPAQTGCESDGTCLGGAAAISPPSERPVACYPSGGEFCAEGTRCDGASPTPRCWASESASPRSGPTGPRCDEARFCAPALVCGDAEHCCPPDKPQSCGDECCPSTSACVDGACACPAGTSSCGVACCPAGVPCDAGACVGACAESAFPVPCGARCCAAGSRCLDGRCTCPADHPLRCGESACCLEGASCEAGSCACPPARAPCGVLCCAPGQRCESGVCKQD